MQQGSSVPSSNTEMQGLHSILQVALDSLDVELEEELTRYRRQRYRQSRLGGHQSTLSWTPINERSKSASQSLDLPSFNSPPSSPQANQPEAPSVDRTISPSQASVLATQPTVEKERVAQQVKQVTNPPDPVSAAHAWDDRPKSASSPLPLSQFASGSVNQAALATFNADQLAEPVAQPNLARSDADDAPEDYLESTEELLRSIAEETPDLRAERESNLLDSLLTPLGIGSMLLLLLSSATLGYVIMHPSSLDLLTAQDTAGDTGTDPNSTQQSSTSTGAASIPDTPNLAADEFVDLNLDTLSTVPKSESRSTGSQASGSQAASGNSSTTANSGASGKANSNPDSITSSSSSSSSSTPPVASLPPDPVAVAPAEAPSYTAPTYTEPAYTAPAAPEPAYTAPAAIDPAPETSSENSAATGSTPSEAAPQVATTTPNARSGNYYYVVTPYSGDPSLEQAREAVPDAYVRNFSAGASVQLGAFNDPAKAETMLQQLQEQGISAEIYQPQ